jgi:uncharacterized protein YeaO (DUF488 family)
VQLYIKPVYEAPSEKDGTRILVDRLWPRGLTKEKAGVDLWLKEIAPSTELRKWFAHDPAKSTGFKARFHGELEKNPLPLAVLRDKLAVGDVTLLYGAKDEIHNEAVVLQQLLGHGL